MSETTFDVAVLGAGPGGYVAAIRAADLGASVALIESGPSGGTCLNVGCIPTKAMLHASELFYEVASAGPSFGIHADNLRFELAEQVDAKDKVVARLRGGLDKVISLRPGIHRFVAFGRLAGPGKIALFDPASRSQRVGEVVAKNVIIATGSRPVRPRAFAFGGRIVTTDEILSLRQQPKRLLVLGGGVNGCEQATFFAEIGTAVTIVEALERILPPLDEDISKEVAKGLKKRKVTIHTGRRAASIEVVPLSPPLPPGGGSNGDVVLTTLDDGTAIETDVALVAIGRTANLDDIGLETVSLSPSPSRFLSVDDHCRTTVSGIYAIGDVTGVAPYAHVAFRQGEIAAANAVGRDESDDMTVIPAGIFTHPEVGTVGLSEHEAASRGIAVKVARFPLQALGIAQAQQLASGWVKLLIDPAGDRILGAAAVSPKAAEIVHELAVAIRHGMTARDIVGTIHAHPTYSESIKEAAEHYLGLPIHGLKG
ncbi:MAG: dihydrolipoyl dehydrogenase [Phycisphaerae bacterium]|nr:dihydrolipoyl dehydrogenase [Phycisphaerae bacterium]